MELVHSDPSGKLPKTPGGSQYYLIFVDDFSRHTWVFFLPLKKKDEPLQAFLKFKALAEAQSGKKIRRFRCDNGRGEYNNKQFKDTLVLNGIQYEPALPYS